MKHKDKLYTCYAHMRKTAHNMLSKHIIVSLNQKHTHEILTLQCDNATEYIK